MTTLDRLRRYEATAILILGWMEGLAKSVDPIAAEQFALAAARVSTGVFLFKLGQGNPLPAIPAYVELGGEGG